MRDHSTKTSLSLANVSRRKASWFAGIALLLMAIVAPLAQFGVLESLVVPEDASTTVGNIVASPGRLWLAGAAFVVVALLDVVVAWTLHVFLRRVDRVASSVAAWLCTVYAAVLAVASTNLFDVAQLASDRTSLQPGDLQTQIMSSLSSFHTRYEQGGLTIFSFHLLGLGYLVYRSADFPRFLGVLVVVAGAGYLFDSVGQMLISDFGATVAQFTFVGEALLIFWLFWRGVKGFATEANPDRDEVGSQAPQTVSVMR